MTEPATTISYSDAWTRLAEIDAETGALWDERDRIFAAMKADGRMRAVRAMKAAGFGFGESIVATRKWGHQIGVLIKVGVGFSPHKAGDTWGFYLWYRSILKSGRLGRKLDYRHFSCTRPEDLPAQLQITGTTDKKKALDHPRIIRLSEYRVRK